MMFKKFLSFAVAMTVLSTLFLTACGKKEAEVTETAKAPTQAAETVAPTPEPAADTSRTGGLVLPLTEAKVKYQWMLEEHSSYPVKQDWPVIKELERLTNVEIEFLPVPSSNYKDKTNVLIASNQVPDIMVVNVGDSKNRGIDGAFLVLSDYLDKYAPNLTKLLNDKKYEATILRGITASDGKIYGFPQFNDEMPTEAWLYRKDILAKENLAVPTTTDELLAVMKTLKEKYPDAYPFVSRFANGGWFLTNLCNLWGIEGQPEKLIKTIDGKTTFLLTDPRFKSMTEYAAQMYAAGLIPQDYPLIQKAQWQEMFLTGKAFITREYKWNAEMLNNENKKAPSPIPNYEMDLMLPPKPADGPGYIAGVDPLGGKCNVLSPKIKNPEVAVQYFDLLYSELGYAITQFGIEGDTYEKDANGVMKFTKKVNTWDSQEGQDKQFFGIGYNNIGHLNNFSTEERKYSEAPATWQYHKEIFEKNLIQPVNPKVFTTQEETDYLKTKEPAIAKYFAENIDKFITGKRPMSEWDNFVKEFDKFEMQKVLEIKQAQYDRTYKK